MAATTLCCMVLVLPTVLEARKPSRRTARIRRERREVLIYADNRTANEALFRFAVVGDNHYWQSTSRRAAFMATSDARDLRDGLLVGDSPQVLQTMVGQLKTFASSGGSFAVHIGDTQCGGSSFSQTRAEYEQALKRVAAIERAELGRWPVLHIPGNHDLDPFGGGLQAWRGVFRNATARQEEPWQGPAGASYGVVRRAGWRLLMLDSMDSLPSDTDGHGHIGQAQLRWMQLQLAAAADAGESVMLLMHQLLVEPQDAEGELPPFLDLRQDFIDNRHEVLRLLRQHPHVRLALHGHVHANTLATQHGIAFASGASAGEFPMQWREVHVLPCEVRLRAHELGLPQLLDKSRRRETRGVNEGKAGREVANINLVFQGFGCPKTSV